MPAKPVKKKKAVTAKVHDAAPSNFPVALDAAKSLVVMLKTVTDAIPNMPTAKLTELVAAMKPVEKTVTDMNGGARTELIERVRAGDTHFTRVGNSSVVDVGELTVALRQNEKMVEVEGGLKWLRLHHGSQFIRLTKRDIRVTDAATAQEVYDQLSALTQNATKGRVRVEDLTPLLAQLHAVLETTVRLDDKAVEKAVKNGDLTLDEVRQHLFKIEGEGDPTYKPSFTMTVTARKETNADNH
jgi:hypothetical protein